MLFRAGADGPELGVDVAALSRRLQPLIQMAASFPAPMIFPIIVAGFLHFGVGLGISSIALLMVGTQWYVLFNAIAVTGTNRWIWHPLSQSAQSRFAMSS